MRLRRLLIFTFAFALYACPGPAFSDVEVNVRKDKIQLVDGSEIECIILGVTSKGVLIVIVDDKDPDKTRQQFIPNKRIRKIVPGDNDGSIKDLGTNSELANKVISGKKKAEGEKTSVGLSKQALHEPAEDSITPVPRTESPATAETLPEAPKRFEKTTPTAPSVKDAEPHAENEKKIPATTKMTAAELAGAYMEAFPELKSTADTFLGAEGVTQTFQLALSDPDARTQTEDFLNEYVDSGDSVLTGKSGPVGKMGKHGLISRTPKLPSKSAVPVPQPAPAPQAADEN